MNMVTGGTAVPPFRKKCTETLKVNKTEKMRQGDVFSERMTNLLQLKVTNIASMILSTFLHSWSNKIGNVCSLE
jgi:hypothetical protein